MVTGICPRVVWEEGKWGNNGAVLSFVTDSAVSNTSSHLHWLHLNWFKYGFKEHLALTASCCGKYISISMPPSLLKPKLPILSNAQRNGHFHLLCPIYQVQCTALLTELQQSSLFWWILKTVLASTISLTIFFFSFYSRKRYMYLVTQTIMSTCLYAYW